MKAFGAILVASTVAYRAEPFRDDGGVKARRQRKTIGLWAGDGEQWATGIRDIDSVDWSPVDGHLYGIMHGRDNTNRLWPDLVSADDDFHIADEMHRITHSRAGEIPTDWNCRGPRRALYVADSQKGRIWRIAYQGDPSRTTRHVDVQREVIGSTPVRYDSARSSHEER